MAKKSNKKTFLIIGIILVLFLLTGVIGRAMGWFESDTSTLVEVGDAERRTITQLVSSSGVLRPEVEVVLTPDVSGEIIELRVKEGDFVNQGDLLLRIRPDLYQARIDEIQAVLLNSKAREQQARAGMLRSRLNYEKQQELYERRLIPEMEYITAKTQFEADEANYNAARYSVQSTEAQLRRAQEELRQTVVRAPMSGTISRLNVERGERVVGSVQMTGTEMLRIARMDQMQVEVRVNENDIVKVSVGDTARVLVDAYPGRNIQGIVTEIANSGIRRGEGTTEQVAEYPVKIRVLSPHNLTSRDASFRRADAGEIQADEQSPYLKPGMSAAVDIETQTVVNVVSVPIQAVTVRDFSKLTTRRTPSDTVNDDSPDDPGTQVQQVRDTDATRPGIQREDMRRVIFLVDDNKVSMVEVETGINDDQYIHILRGVDEGNVIVTGNYRVLSRQLKDGDAVRVRRSLTAGGSGD